MEPISRRRDSEDVLRRQRGSANRHGGNRRGPRTALSQVVAEELAMSLDQITVAQLDTDVTPYDISTSASSSMVVMGTAVQRAAQDAKKQLLQCAAKVLKQKVDHLAAPRRKSPFRRRRRHSYGKVIVDFFGSKAGEIIGKGLYKDKRHQGNLGVDDDFLGGRLGSRGGRGGS